MRVRARVRVFLYGVSRETSESPDETASPRISALNVFEGGRVPSSVFFFFFLRTD